MSRLRAVRVGAAAVFVGTFAVVAALRWPHISPGSGAGAEPDAPDDPRPLDQDEPAQRGPSDIVGDTLAAFSSYRQLAEDVRDFSEKTRVMTREEREARGRELVADVDKAKADGLLVADQPLYMKIAIFRSVYGEDEQALGEAVAEARAEREAEIAARPPIDHGPLHDRYKAEEARILDEVLGMSSYPRGLSREEYLAERLAEARARIYETTEEQ